MFKKINENIENKSNLLLYIIKKILNLINKYN